MAKMNKNKGAICILGGMGPEASARMLEVMVSMAAQDFGAKNGDDFPEIILFSVPVPDFISNKRKLARALSMLKERVNFMNSMDVSSAAIACNTAHILLADLQKFSKVPFVSIIEAVGDEVEVQGISKVGILASPLTIGFGLFQRTLEKREIGVIIPNKRQLIALERIIRSVIAGCVTKRDVQELVSIARDMKRRGAEGIILGCTELPLVFPQNFSLPVFDSIKIVARALLSNHFDSRRKGGTIS
ncbi:MAG: aspartate/glutamate racemase family protein [Candidatus Blackburnbacteria bacterium]|nr:aspartate/glutamate racemase family protein [Candidatus Blackburnbacteria bacterium]